MTSAEVTPPSAGDDDEVVARSGDAATTPRHPHYQRGTPATCESCGITGHRTALCVTHLLPDVVVHTTGRRKARLQHYFLTSPLYAAYHTSVVNSDREGALLYLRTSDPSAVLHTAQRDSVINRHFYAVYLVHDTTRHIDRLLLPFSTASGVTAVRLQCYPKSIAAPVLDVLREGGVATDPRAFSHVLFVLFAYRRYHYALAGADHHYTHIHQRLDANIGPATAAAQPPPTTPFSQTAIVVNGESTSFDAVVCRAYWKLKEVFSIEPDLRVAPGTRAIDLGASPGGWTSFLVSAGCSLVVAVDPGELLITPSPCVIHVQRKAQDSLAELLAHGPYQLLCCDMNAYSLLSVHSVLSLCSLLSPRAALVLTVKELQSGQSKRLQAGAMELLACAFDGLRSHFLLANGRERTVVGWRRERWEGDEAEVKAVMDGLEEELRREADFIKAKALRLQERGQHAKLGKKFARNEQRNALRQQREQVDVLSIEGDDVRGSLGPAAANSALGSDT